MIRLQRRKQGYVRLWSLGVAVAISLGLWAQNSIPELEDKQTVSKGLFLLKHVSGRPEKTILYGSNGHHQPAHPFLNLNPICSAALNNQSQTLNTHDLLPLFYRLSRDLESVWDKYCRYITIRDTMDVERIHIKIAGMESEKTEDRENEITSLQLKRNRLPIYLVSTVAVLIALIFYLLFRNHLYRQKVRNIEYKRTTDRRILDMERRILATVIETENRERKRFGIELHDGLGPLLSSAKLYLGEILDSDKSEQIEMVNQATDIIDAAIRNTREIAGNIIPPTLSERGLKISIDEFCRKIERISGLKISNNISDLRMGQESIISPGLGVVIFRILTELINNTVKHAGAANIHISVQEKKDDIEILFDDDGNGFEVKEALNSESGMGLKNIIERIRSLHGKIKIESEKNRGTSILISVPI